MSGKDQTPGRAAYVAYSESFASIDNPAWTWLDDDERNRWEAVAIAAAAPAHERTAEAVAELNAVRAVTAEVLDALERSRMFGSRAWTADIPLWRKRAGLEPAVATAGTEHLVDELYPGGPRWQQVAGMPAREG